MSQKENIKRLGKLTHWIKISLYAQVLVALLSILFTFLEYRLLSAFENGFYDSLDDTFADGEKSIMLLQVSGLISLVLFIMSAVLIIRWIYLANTNIRQLGAKDMRFTPAWAVGNFFIPIFNLWKPYSAMKEIWFASREYSGGDLKKTTYILPTWWALWLISNIVNQSVFRLSAKASELGELINLNLLSQFSHVLDIPLAFVTLAMINGIYKMQNSKI